jgi:superfamily I DNA and/or RNA helicase
MQQLLYPKVQPKHHALTYSQKKKYIETCKNNILAEIQAVAQKDGKKIVITNENTQDYKEHCIKYQHKKKIEIHLHPDTPNEEDYPWKTYDLGYIGNYIRQLKAYKKCTLPSFVLTNKVKKGEYTCERTKKTCLNENQRKALESLEHNLEIIQGPPGTGKSTTIYHMIRQRLKGQTLVTSQNNQAIAAVCEKLKQHHKSVFEKKRKNAISIVVLGSSNRIAKCCETYHIERLIQNKIKSTNEIIAREMHLTFMEKKISRFKTNIKNMQRSTFEIIVAKIILKRLKYECQRFQLQLQSITRKYAYIYKKYIMRHSTTFLCTVGSSWRVRTVKNIIVDEAATVKDECMVLLFNKKATNFILVGDHKQLPPFTGVNHFKPISFFERMTKNGHKVHLLRTQYRMSPSIGNMVSKLFYENKLKNGISYDKDTLCWHNHTSKENKEEFSYRNICEIQTIKKNIDKYMLSHPEDSIMVITFYNAQRVALQKHIGDKIKVFTVDSCQGMESDAVFISCVRSNKQKIIGFCRDKNRLCVALARAKKYLNIVGNKKTFSKNKLWCKVAQSAINLCHNKKTSR